MPPQSLTGPTARSPDQRLASWRGLGAVATAIVLATWLVVFARGEPGYAPAQIEILGEETNATIDHWDAPRPEGVGVATWAIPDDEIAVLDGAPAAIELSGPFSAEIVINGAVIGGKGQPGANRALETPGPIDASILIPNELLRAEGNQVTIRYSAHYLNYNPAHLLQGLRLVRYDADPRRPLRYYGATLFSVGAVAALALALWRLGQTRADHQVYLLSIGCLGFLVSAGAEVSRSFVNYPYPWHAPRQAIAGFGIAGFCLCLAAFAALRWPLGKQVLRAGVAAAALSLSAAFVLFSGFDGRTSVAAGSICLIVLIWTVFAGLRDEKAALAIAGLPAALAIAAAITPGRFIDHQALILTVGVLGYLVLLAPDTLSPALTKEKDPDPVDDRFALKDGAKTFFVPAASVLRLKAAGNYTEVYLENGEQRLDQRGIGALLDELPGAFLRIHKSHAARLDAIAELRGSTGSRYAVKLQTGDELPVGRSRLEEIRAALTASRASAAGRTS